MCRAGHLPPVMIRPDGAVEYVGVPANPPIGCGLLSRHAPTSRRIAVEPGTTMVLYTDGLIERRGETLDDGLMRLRDAVAVAAGRDPAAICEHLLEVLGNDLSDDAAVLVLRVEGDV